MNLIVKICGLSTEETLDAALDAGADMVGLVTFAPSPRYVEPQTAARLAVRAYGRAEIVMLTVDMPEAEIAAWTEAVNPDWLQFHGHEPREAVEAAKTRFGRPVMKAVGVREIADLVAAGDYAAVADRLLLDAKAPKGAILPGGRGESFDWRILEGFDPGIPFLLSGGLNPDNVAVALEMVGAASGVDVSSGVETAPGVKDPERVQSFIAAARRAAGNRLNTAERVA